MCKGSEKEVLKAKKAKNLHDIFRDVVIKEHKEKLLQEEGVNKAQCDEIHAKQHNQNDVNQMEHTYQ